MITREKKIIHASAVGIVSNVALCGAKAVIGVLSNSIAIVLDALNNLSDALSSVLTLAGISLASRPADRSRIKKRRRRKSEENAYARILRDQ